jgi:hypothetical protein
MQPQAEVALADLEDCQVLLGHLHEGPEAVAVEQLLI